MMNFLKAKMKEKTNSPTKAEYVSPFPAYLPALPYSDFLSPHSLVRLFYLKYTNDEKRLL